MKSIKISKYFEFINPEYVYLKITPDKSIRNYNSSSIAKSIAHTYKSISQRIRKEQKKIFFETNFKISYIIDIYSNDVEFYFIVPNPFVKIITEKILEVWPNVTIKESNRVRAHSSSAISYQLKYKKEDALSLAVDKKTNEPLNSILSVIDILDEGDRVTIVYNFLPRNKLGWTKQYNDTMKKIKEHKPLERQKLTLEYIVKSVISLLIHLIDSISEVLNDFAGGNNKNNENLLEAVITSLSNEKDISIATKKKKDMDILDTQIAILSSSNDEIRQTSNVLSVCQAYRVLDQDNELLYSRVNNISNFKLDDYKLKGIETNTISTDEAQNFIQLPGRRLLSTFNINHINTTEIQVPHDLQKGFFYLGEVKYKGIKTKAFLEDEYNIGNLPLVLIGSQGSGKTTYIKNIAKYCNKNKEGLFILDFIKNCEMSSDISKIIPEYDLVILNLSKEDDMQGLGYNEINITEDMTTFERLNLANLQSQQAMALIDSISIGDALSSRMRRFFNAAANVVFSQNYSSIKSVIECLESHIKRDMYINNLSDELKAMLEDEINTLKELDEYSKASKGHPKIELIGTRESKIEHILDRVNMLREDFKLKYMYNKPTKNNINLVELMEEGKTVIIQMKESDFPTKMIKNTLVTYWISKIWLTSQLRGSLHEKPLRCNVIVDEIFQAPTCMKTLEYILPQCRKFGCKFIFSTQYIRQLDDIFDTLEASGSSYMLLKGCMEDDFNHLKSKLYNFEYEDLRDMKQWHSLNLVYYSKGYSSFISKLPSPINDKQ
ncbi:hypothetical protein [Clostridium tetani]|uniref:hypothetical protein n=1 Tax=Clostridium tetani TaxID=1513 RepID=UPI000513FAAA|nr:hypothetical protein [Clostridium tetani]KGI36857.1 hypothetical protein LA33_12050 [Clostridium tetani ATCC 9441]SUY82434.1 Type IV secretory pathway, VirD4 components [Clostridium tetani]